MKKPLSLYIHIPFCEAKCNYCSFASFVTNEDNMRAYSKCLIKEIEMQAKKYNTVYEIQTIYIGGGTPSVLPLGLIKEVMSAVYKNFSVAYNAEITIELNPNSASNDKIYEYMLAGVNRFSIGLQCYSDKVLKNMSRLHATADFDKLVGVIKNFGITNISADVMIGYPTEKMGDVERTIKHLIELEIPHISCYMLSVEEGTKLKTMVDNGLVYLPNEGSVINMYNKVYGMLSNAGYTRYELSNYAKPGFMSKHNKVYWNRTDYLGVGLASHSYVAGVRFSNTSSITEYITKIVKEKSLPTAHAKKISLEEEKEEMIMLSLRTIDGLDTKKYEQEFNENLLVKKNEELKKFVKMGLITIDKDNIIRATNAGYLLLNKIIVELV